jgi:hypothetical protein
MAKDGVMPVDATNPFMHQCSYGVVFKADRCDFKGGVSVEFRQHITASQFGLAVAEMIGYHATSILPYMNGFAGYDTVRFLNKTEVDNSVM